MATRHYPSFVKHETDEDKLANIIVSVSLLDEVMTLKLTNHFLKINDTKKNKEDRDIFEKTILSKLSFREKSEIVCRILENQNDRKLFKKYLFRAGEIRNQVAHNTGLFGMPKDIEKVYNEFDALMIELETFIESTYFEFQHDMDYAYTQQYKEEVKSNLS